jgi:hypothetical protein
MDSVDKQAQFADKQSFDYPCSRTPMAASPTGSGSSADCWAS